MKEQELDDIVAPQEKIDELTNKYMDRWGITREKEYFSVRREKVDWSTKKDGDYWFEEDKWYIKRNGIVTSSTKKPSQSRVDMVQFCKCGSCGKLVNNRNEMNVISTRGLCFTCLAEKEFNDIINGIDYEIADVSKFIVIKDSMGVPIMDIDDYRTEYGDEEADRLINEYKQKTLRLRNAT